MECVVDVAVANLHLSLLIVGTVRPGLIPFENAFTTILEKYSLSIFFSLIS